MRQANRSDYTFKVANRAYFDKTVGLTGCVNDILQSELRVLDFTQVSVFSSICLVPFNLFYYLLFYLFIFSVCFGGYISSNYHIESYFPLSCS